MEGKTGIEETYGNLGISCQRLAEFKTALDYHEQDLIIAKVVGHRPEEGCAYANLGNDYHDRFQKSPRVPRATS